MFWYGVLTGSVGSFVGMVGMVVLGILLDLSFDWSEAVTGWLAAGLLGLVAIGILIFGRPIDKQYKLFWLSFSGGGAWMLLIAIALCNAFFIETSLFSDQGGAYNLLRFAIGACLPGLLFGIISKGLKVPKYQLE